MNFPTEVAPEQVPEAIIHPPYAPIYPARLDAAARFLHVLLGAPEGQFTFQTFDDVEIDGVKRGEPSIVKLLHGSLSGCASSLEYLNNLGAGVFVTINQTDFRGRTSKNIIGVRALFIDKDDGRIDESRVTLPPSIRVKTAHGEHVYWLLSQGESVEDWKSVQQILIQHFQSDPKIHNRDRVLRLPGFWHCKGQPQLLDDVWYGDLSRRFTLEDVRQAYPRARLVGGASLPKPLTLYNASTSTAKAVQRGGRNVYLTSVGGALRTKGAEYDAILIALRAENAAFSEPLGDPEVDIIARSVSRYEPTIDPSLNSALAGMVHAAAAPGAIVAPSSTPPSWLQLLVTDTKGVPKSCVSNVAIVLENHPAWQGTLGLNVRAAEIVFLKQPPVEKIDGPFPRSLRDEDYTRIGMWLTSAQKMGDVNTAPATLAVAARHQFDPVVNYLDSHTWDQVPRLAGMLANYCGAYDAPPAYLAIVGVKWAIQCVARALWPGCQGDATLILEGKQGRGKTSFFRIMAGAWLGEHPPREMGQKMQEFIRGPWIVEFGELSSFKRSEIEEIKSFLTLREDRYRPAYGRTIGTWPRRCAFGGSTNGDMYLVDLENRRYWPVKCQQFDLEGLARDRDQLWAEAVYYYDNGIQWHLTPEEFPLFAREQSNRVFEDAITEDIRGALVRGVRRDALGGFPGMVGEWGIVPNAGSVSVLEITKHLYISREHDPRLQGRVVAALRKLGWIRDVTTGRWMRPAQ